MPSISPTVIALISSVKKAMSIDLNIKYNRNVEECTAINETQKMRCSTKRWGY